MQNCKLIFGKQVISESDADPQKYSDNQTTAPEKHQGIYITAEKAEALPPALDVPLLWERLSSQLGKEKIFCLLIPQQNQTKNEP